MGEAELKIHNNQLVIHSVLFFYGNAASDELSQQIANDVASYWNAAKGSAIIRGNKFDVIFNIEGIWARQLIPEMIFENTNPRNNYFRIEEYASGNISFVDAVNCNTIGLEHPEDLDIRGRGIPGIMYPRGTIVDSIYQYDSTAEAFGPGGTINPATRKVLQQDIDDLKLHKLHFNRKGMAVLGAFSSIWHERQMPQ